MSTKQKTPQDYHDLAASKGLAWLGPPVDSTTRPTNWRCLAGQHTYESSYSAVSRARGCRQCALALSAQVASLLRTLKAGDGYEQLLAVRALAVHSGTPDVAAQLAEIVASTKPPLIRTEAIRAIAPLVGQNPVVSTAMMRALDDRIWTVRLLAMGALARLASTDADLEAKLVTLLRASSSRIRLAALQVLERAGNLDKPLVCAAVTALLEDRAADVRAAAVQALGITPARAPDPGQPARGSPGDRGRGRHARDVAPARQGQGQAQEVRITMRKRRMTQKTGRVRRPFPMSQLVLIGCVVFLLMHGSLALAGPVVYCTYAYRTGSSACTLVPMIGVLAFLLLASVAVIKRREGTGAGQEQGPATARRLVIDQAWVWRLALALACLLVILGIQVAYQCA